MTAVVVIAPRLAERLGLRAMLSASAEVQVSADAASLADLSDALVDEVGVVVVDAAALDADDLTHDIFTGERPAALLLLGADPATAAALLENPLRAWGVLPSEATPEELAAAIHALDEGLIAGSPELLRRLLVQPVLDSAAEPLTSDLVEALSERETQVLDLLAQGLANKQIALELNISAHTVKFHISSIYGKLGAASRTEAVRLGLQNGLISL